MVVASSSGDASPAGVLELMLVNSGPLVSQALAIISPAPSGAAHNDLTPLTHWRLAKELTIGQNLNVRCCSDGASVPDIRFATKFNLNSGTDARSVSLRYD